MQPGSVDLVLLAVITAGCMVIHACRHRPDDITVLLVLAVIGLLNVFGAAMLSRSGPDLDPAFHAEILNHRPLYD